MNLDAMDQEELWALHRRLSEHLVAEARKLFPEQPQGYVAAACYITHYVANKAIAMELRAAGEIADALRYEAICDRLYTELPRFARW